MENYFNSMMADTAQLLTQKVVKWPSELTKEQKVELYVKIIRYCEKTEDYAKCSIISKRLKRMGYDTFGKVIDKSSESK